ncbi:MAG: outer membrane lipoprotein carrier protein LolA [Proteobacteria bacterium]|nr:outer membrane lipoprotein carrier protein LolA [Pseudomonadota bacterium]
MGTIKDIIIMRRITIVLTCIICAFASRGYASPFDAIKKAYSEITTMQATFHQKIYIAGLKKGREFDGEFFYKRQRGFLWRYNKPKVKYFLYDGKYIWQSEDEKPFVIKERINKAKTGGTFLDLIEDISKIDELFTLKQQSLSGELEILELLPKKDGTVNLAKVWIDKRNMVRKIEIHEFTGNINTVEFSSIKVNQGIDDTKFIFKPDKQKEIIER